MKRLIYLLVGLVSTAMVLVGLTAPAQSQKPGRTPSYDLGVGIYAGGVSFPVDCDGGYQHPTTYVATSPGQGNLRIEPRAKHWGERDLIAEISVHVTVESGQREQQWAQQWHVGPYSNRTGLDSELAQVEQRYWVGTGDGYLPNADRSVLFEVYAKYQLDSQGSEPVATCVSRIRVIAGEE
ncbi:MAG: hypothetical protein ACRD0W_12565 [Acidimicrobiales bacterium]